jgi:hypothetical protein
MFHSLSSNVSVSVELLKGRKTSVGGFELFQKLDLFPAQVADVIENIQIDRRYFFQVLPDITFLPRISLHGFLSFLKSFFGKFDLSVGCFLTWDLGRFFKFHIRLVFSYFAHLLFRVIFCHKYMIFKIWYIELAAI